jgi:hypothetical protein
MPIPCLYGMSRKDAMKALAEASLTVGTIIYDTPKDSTSSKVYRQLPSCGRKNMVNMGTAVDLFFTTNQSKIPAIKDSLSLNDNEDDEDFD